MRKKKEIDLVIRRIIAAIVLLLLFIWIGDSLLRVFRKPSSTVVIIDDRQPLTETAQPETSPETLPEESQDESNVKIWDASLEPATLPAGYTTERKTEESVHEGILLWIETQYSGAEIQFGSFEDKNSCYRLKSNELCIQNSALRAMNALAQAYEQETGMTNLMVYSTTELYETEGSLYPDYLPDRSTGFCLDLAFLNEDGTISGISQLNNGWLKENAWRFGFVFSVPQAGYHLRYIGRLHAAVMHEYDLTLEEYLAFLRKYSFSAPFRYTYEEKNMLIYFVPAAAFGSTDIPVPENKNCEISGNDKDGFIVWTAENYE